MPGAPSLHTALANYSDKAEDPKGVETRVITYSGRDSDTMPPVWAARNSRPRRRHRCLHRIGGHRHGGGAKGVKRAPWANAPFIPGALGDYMKAQFDFFGSDAIADSKRPVMAGLNYFLTEQARGGSGSGLLGEKKDVKVWLGWLERRAHGEIDAIETPIGFIPRYEDLKGLFETLIDKPYPKDLYDRQFSLYVDNILARNDLQTAAYGKEENIPATLFDVLREQRDG
jgi:phosphoenolpyruvate carboxykinase (GTP)